MAFLRGMAERVGFEPTLPFRVNTLSKRAPSATRPSLPRSICRSVLGSCYGVAQSAAESTAIKRSLILWPEPLKPQGADVRTARIASIDQDCRPGGSGVPARAKAPTKHPRHD